MALQPLKTLPRTPLKIKRALISVFDKSEIVTLAKELHKHGVELISTGGTAQKLREADLPVTDVSEITNFRECLDGRVKTLHPHIHGGILARTSHKPDVKELEKLGINPIELIVTNLYPFSETVEDPDCTMAKATEFIDIGGPTMIRAAAKNFAHVTVLTDPHQYEYIIQELREDEAISYETRFHLAREAFHQTAEYDIEIANYLDAHVDEEEREHIRLSLDKSQELRYGENPQQQAAVYGYQDMFIDCFHGKQLSYNNFLDVDGAMRFIGDFEKAGPTVAIFKHTVPCGAATAGSLEEAWHKAFATDTVSPFGGIVIVNKELDLETARAIDEIFTEIIIAPKFSKEALNLLTKKKNRRLIRQLHSLSGDITPQLKSIFGGLLIQEPDAEPIKPSSFKTVTKRQLTKEELNDAVFAWKVVKHVKSNAIVYAKAGQTLGIGTGQTSRVEASEIAIAKAKQEGLSLDGSIIASDAFFPFADGVEAAAKAGATVVIQPGGSIRDEEVIAKADEYGMAMVFTGKRHFKH